MADRYVTLTATTIGTDISEVDIYYSSITPSNLIQSGVTRAQISTGYTFLDDSSHDIYVIETDSPCDTNVTVNIAVSPTPTPTVTPSISVSPSVTPTQSVTPSITPTQSVTPTQSITPTVTVTPTQSITPTVTVTVTPSSSVTPTLTPTPSITPTTSITPTPSTSITPSITPTQSVTPTTSVTPSITPTNSVTPTVSVTVTPTTSVTPSITPTTSVTPSITPTTSVTPSITPTTSVTPSITPTQSITPTTTVTPTVTPSITPSVTTTPSITPTNSITPTSSVSVTPSISPSITPSMTVTPSVTPSAAVSTGLLFMEASGDATCGGNVNTDICAYMLGKGDAVWYGFATSGAPDLTNSGQLSDFLYWMDWPGFRNGTSNTIAVEELTVPQSAGGTDTHGNAIAQYVFETVEIPAGSFTVGNTVYFAFVVPHALLNSSSQVYSTIGYDYTSSASDAVTTTTSTASYRTTDVTYTGSNWENTTFRVHSNAGVLARTISSTDNTNDFYFRGGALVSG